MASTRIVFKDGTEQTVTNQFGTVRRYLNEAAAGAGDRFRAFDRDDDPGRLLVSPTEVARVYEVKSGDAE
jgi:hypothetical protein